MAQRDRTPSLESASDKLSVLMDTICRFALTVGAAATLLGIGFLLYNFSISAHGVTGMEKQALANIEVFGMVAMVGILIGSLAVTYLQWGEEVLGPLLVIGWAALYFSPMYLPSIFGQSNPNNIGAAALQAVQRASIPLGVVGLMAVIVDVVTRVRTRSREGAKADQLKIGKGLKEEKDIRNVFLGKCWQLPYCRKFVRERCPIYHARRTCWKERVGCMCDESVIRHAMEGRVIPSDTVAAAQYIPRSTKLTPEQKVERCRQCVIYNEHQKHKYKLAMPVALGGTAAVYVFFHDPLSQGVQGMIKGVDRMVQQATLKDTGQGDVSRSGLGSGEIPFHEVILVALLIVGLAYVIRFIEFLFFKMKV